MRDVDLISPDKKKRNTSWEGGTKLESDRYKRTKLLRGKKKKRSRRNGSKLEKNRMKNE